MKKYLCIISILVILNAQESIGFSNPDQLSILKEFTLPTYQYTKIDFGATGNIRSEYLTYYYYGNYYYGNEKVKTKTNHLGAFTNTEYVFDSERLFYFVSLDLGFSENNSENYDEEITTDILNYGLELEARYYAAASNSFVYGKISHLEEVKDISEEGSHDLLLSDLNTFYSAGIGFGKVRNVNHVIRAIRLSERLEAIGEDALSDDELMNVAAELGKLGAITKTFVRHKREIWGNIFSVMQLDVTDIEPQDLFYLDEIFDEVIGNRKEGSEILLRYNSIYRRTKFEQNTFKDNNHNKANFLELSTRYYYNSDLNNQMRFGINLLYEIPDENVKNYSNTIIQPSVGFLYNVTDRILFETDFTYSKNTIEQGSRDSEKNIILMNSKFTYFIENSLSAGINFDYEEFSSESSISDLNRNLSFFINYSFINSYQ